MIAAHVVNEHNKHLYETDIVAYIEVSEAALASAAKSSASTIRCSFGGAHNQVS